MKRFLLKVAMALGMTVMVAGMASVAVVPVLAEPVPCTQSVQDVSGGGGSGPAQADVELVFNATCPGAMLVTWQAINGVGAVAWQSQDHLHVSSRKPNLVAAEWVFGTTPAGAYNIYVILAGQGGRTVYFHDLWMPVVIQSGSAASIAASQTLAEPASCAQSLTPVGAWGSGTSTWVSFGIGFTATCPGAVLVAWQVTDANGRVIWRNGDHHYVVSTTSENDASMAWNLRNVPPGTYNVYVTLASQNHQTIYFHSLWGQPIVS